MERDREDVVEARQRAPGGQPCDIRIHAQARPAQPAEQRDRRGEGGLGFGHTVRAPAASTTRVSTA